MVWLNQIYLQKQKIPSILHVSIYYKGNILLWRNAVVKSPPEVPTLYRLDFSVFQKWFLRFSTYFFFFFYCEEGGRKVPCILKLRPLTVARRIFTAPPPVLDIWEFLVLGKYLVVSISSFLNDNIAVNYWSFLHFHTESASTVAYFRCSSRPTMLREEICQFTEFMFN